MRRPLATNQRNKPIRKLTLPACTGDAIRRPAGSQRPCPAKAAPPHVAQVSCVPVRDGFGSRGSTAGIRTNSGCMNHFTLIQSSQPVVKQRVTSNGTPLKALGRFEETRPWLQQSGVDCFLPDSTIAPPFHTRRQSRSFRTAANPGRHVSPPRHGPPCGASWPSVPSPQRVERCDNRFGPVFLAGKRAIGGAQGKNTSPTRQLSER